ncbi:hypothetical protein, partial [Salmonella enterica]|uniref:hypothetical protein n=1 Tax=Salmonella enterica TaxID=28901 RepID=UPI0035269195
ELPDEEKLHIYKRILSHHGPYKASDPEYKGSKWNLKIEWEDGTITFEPLTIMIKDDPAGCAKYGKENDMLEEEGWKKLKRIAKREKLMKRMAKQAALASKRKAPIYSFGVQVPRNEEEARQLDNRYAELGTARKWEEAEDIE